MLLGCIADDSTGATDLAAMLAAGGMRTVQWFGPPAPGEVPDNVDALVVALKSRSAPPAEAIASSLAALTALQALGAKRFLLKYCSTFDSTAEGNIGPVAEALIAAVGARQTIFCPAFPENGRSVYLGHLFVHGRLLNESGMEHHPLTPMTDADLVRVLQRQAKGRCGLLSYRTVMQGPAAIAQALADHAARGASLVVCDALNDEHLRSIGRAVADMPLVTGSAGVALGLPAAYREIGELDAAPASPVLPAIRGHSAVLAGSCSPATQRQVAAFRQSHPARALDVRAAMRGDAEAHAAAAWAAERLAEGPVLIDSTVAPDELRRIQADLGGRQAAAAVEQTMADIAAALVAAGVRRLVVAGGETAGAIMQRLGVRGLRIGPSIDPGVPWTQSLGDPPLALALKSGNFGGDDFFLRSLAMLP